MQADYWGALLGTAPARSGGGGAGQREELDSAVVSRHFAQGP